MTSALGISDSLALPLDTVTDTIGVLAVKGAGKTFTFLVMVEEMVRQGLPVVVLDPVGVCWGLRSSADGKGPGLPVVIVGGQHGDVPLEEGAGAVLADWVIAERRPAVFDLSELPTKAASIRFALDFLTRLYTGSRREPIHVVIDEADEFAPQKPFGEETRLLRAVEILVRRGRAKGLGVTMVTQRPAVLSKNVLTQIGTLIVGRTTSPQDRKAVDEWVIAHATEAQRKTFLASLASLPTREKWVWSPERDVFARVAIRGRATFDSSATPKAGELRFEPKKLAPVDLDALRARIAATKEEEEAPPGEHETVTVRVEVPAPYIPEALMSAAAEVIRAFENAVTSISALSNALAASAVEGARVLPPKDVEELQAAYAGTTSNGQPGFGLTVAAADLEEDDRDVVVTRDKPMTRGGRVVARAESKLGGAERKVLTVLAQHRKGLSHVQVAILAGYSSTSGGFRNTLSALRSAGRIDGGRDRMTITASGTVDLGRFEPLPRGRALLAYWEANAGGKCERMILGELASVHPRSLPKEALASRTGYRATSGGFRNALSRLRTLQLIKGSRELGLSAALGEAIS